MENEKSPLSFFEDLLEKDKYKTLQNDYMDMYKEKYESIQYEDRVFDYEQGIIIEDEDTDLSFAPHFEKLINTEYHNAKQNFDKAVSDIVKKNTPPNEFLTLQLEIINYLIINAEKFYSNYPFVNQAIIKLKEHLITKYNINGLPNNKVKSPINSFQWDYLEGCEADAVETLKRLFNELVGNSTIEGSEEDFVNGFMGKEVQNGIRWLIKTKDNKHSSKPTLFAFINYLIEENFIRTVEEKNYNDAVKYVFREYNGNVLKNIRQSKSSTSTPIPENIKGIIDNL